MSSLLKQDTYYSEFGDSGALYTYPASVSITLGQGPRVTIYSVIANIERDVGIVPSRPTETLGPQNLVVGFNQGVSLSGGSLANIRFFSKSILDIDIGGMISKDPVNTFIFADSEYKEPGKTQVLTDHSFVLTGD
jgi:hypothetical protein